MTKLEIIRIRLFNLSDKNQITILFQQFKEKLNKMKDRDMVIVLLKNKDVENDWSIHLASLKNSANKKVSNLAALLVETFRAIGMVNHDAWEPLETINDSVPDN
jgi:hypothetical protein